MEKFYLGQFLWTCVVYGNKREPKNSPIWTFSTFAQMFIVLTVFDFLRKPIEKYYHYDDPLKLENESEGSIDQSLERQRYKKRLATKEFMAEK